MSARSPRIEVLVGPERRRRWSAEQKRAIVAESLRSTTSLSAVARKHGLNTGQLYTWRRLFARSAVPAFAHVELTREPPRIETSARASGTIEIVLPDGTVVRTDALTSEATLRRVLKVLRER